MRAVSKRELSHDNDASSPRKMRRIMSDLPDRMLLQSNHLHPQDVVNELLSAQGVAVEYQSFESIGNFFHAPTQEEIEGYKFDVINAIRRKDVECLRAFHQEGRPLKCSNQFGESLLHLACRKNMFEVVTFLVKEAAVPLQVTDDYGRTPLHDACWTATPNFDLVNFIVSECPDLLYIKDRRGFTPLSYVRKKHHQIWNAFLKEKADQLIPNTLEKQLRPQQ